MELKPFDAEEVVGEFVITGKVSALPEGRIFDFVGKGAINRAATDGDEWIDYVTLHDLKTRREERSGPQWNAWHRSYQRGHELAETI